MSRSSELISGYFDGTLSDEQFDALIEWLNADDANAAEFIRASWDHSNLRDICHGEDVREFHSPKARDGLELLASGEPVREGTIAEMLDEELASQQRAAHDSHDRDAIAGVQSYRPDYERRTRRPEPIVIPWGVVYAVGTAAAVGMVFLIRSMWPEAPQVAQSPPEVVAPPLATIVDAVDAMWSIPTLATAPGTELTAGTATLASGIVEIEFNSGARLIVEAPAEMNLMSADRVRLDAGKVVGNVPRDAVGFTVKTPSAAIVDLGTEFGIVAREDGASEVHVLDGAVEVVPGGESANDGALENSRIAAGSAVLVNQAGEVAPVELQAGAFFRNVPRVVSYQEVLKPSYDARLVDRDGDGLGDRVDPLSQPPSAEEERPRQGPNQPSVGVGERNNEFTPDLDERRYWISFNLDASQVGQQPDAKFVDSVQLVLTLAEMAHVQNLRVDVVGVHDVETRAAAPSDFETVGEALASGAFDGQSAVNTPVSIDVTQFVRQQLRKGRTTCVFRLQAVGGEIPNGDGRHNSFVFHSRHAGDEQSVPRLVVSARRYE